MSIRLRCPNITLSRPVTVTVISSAVPLLKEGDHVEFHTHAGQTDFGELRVAGRVYRVANIRFLGEISDERHTFVECELADDPTA